MAEHIGLIGGIGPAATDYYYRRIISKFADHGQILDLTMVHANTSTLLRNLEIGDYSSQVEIYSRLTDRLVSAGANFSVVTSVAGHFCIEQFKEVSPLPVIDLIETVHEEVGARDIGRVGILGTLTVMESHFYAGLSSVETVIPPPSMIRSVHDAYISIAKSAAVSDNERTVFDSACQWFLDVEKVDAVLLGGTDLTLVYAEGNAPFPIVDCAAIHADAIAQWSI